MPGVKTILYTDIWANGITVPRLLCGLIGAKRKDTGTVPTVGPSVIICVVNA